MKLLISLFVVGIFAIVKGENDTDTNQEGKIVGGFETDIRYISYQAALVEAGNSRIFCGGSIISPNWILTAAHCVPGVFPNQMRVRVGSSDYMSGGQLLVVYQILSNPRYQLMSEHDFDIALINVSPMSFNQNVQPIRLAGSGQVPAVGSTLWVSGWGHQYFQGTSPRIVRAVDVKMVNWSVCRRSYGNTLTDRMICAADNGKDACQNDSGGPLVMNGVLYGVVSFGEGCAKPGFPGVYANVGEANLRRYIRDNTGI